MTGARATRQMVRRPGEEVVRACAVAALLILPPGAFGQEAVGLVSTRYRLHRRDAKHRQGVSERHRQQ
jgi:hypothetical protein